MSFPLLFTFVLPFVAIPLAISWQKREAKKYEHLTDEEIKDLEWDNQQW